MFALRVLPLGQLGLGRQKRVFARSTASFAAARRGGGLRFAIAFDGVCVAAVDGGGGRDGRIGLCFGGGGGGDNGERMIGSLAPAHRMQVLAVEVEPGVTGARQAVVGDLELQLVDERHGGDAYERRIAPIDALELHAHLGQLGARRLGLLGRL